MNPARTDSTQNEIAWWLHPVAVFVVLNGLTCVAAILASNGAYLELWGEPKYVDLSTVLLNAAILLTFSAGVWLAMAKQSGQSKTESDGTVSFTQILLLFNISFWVCIMAYTTWATLGISRGLGLGLLKAIFMGGDESIYTLRDSLATVPGVTTWTQVSIAAVILGSIIGIGGGWRIVRRKLVILISLSLVRALLYSERLAFLELAIPFLVLWLAQPAHWKQSRALRILVRIAPVLGGAVIYIVFTVFESFRSWSIYYSARQSSLLLFGLWRLVGYYVTSLNNSAYYLAISHRSLGAPYFTLSFLWKFPGLNIYIKDIFNWVHLDYKGYMALLALGANPEFNNAGGLLSPVMDFGVLGGLAYWALMGLVTGYLYNLYMRKHLLGLCMYPVVFLTLSEVPRYLYWGEGRAFPALAYLILSVAVLLRSTHSTDEQRDGISPLAQVAVKPDLTRDFCIR